MRGFLKLLLWFLTKKVAAEILFTTIRQTGNEAEDATARLQLAGPLQDNKLITDSDYVVIKAWIISEL